MTRRPALVALLLSLALPADAQWPQFRGPDGNGVASGSTLPLKWSGHRSIEER